MEREKRYLSILCDCLREKAIERKAEKVKESQLEEGREARKRKEERLEERKGARG